MVNSWSSVSLATSSLIAFSFKTVFMFSVICSGVSEQTFERMPSTEALSKVFFTEPSNTSTTDMIAVS
jgi:hypothetical protein